MQLCSLTYLCCIENSFGWLTNQVAPNFSLFLLLQKNDSDYRHKPKHKKSHSELTSNAISFSSSSSSVVNWSKVNKIIWTAVVLIQFTSLLETKVAILIKHGEWLFLGRLWHCLHHTFPSNWLCGNLIVCRCRLSTSPGDAPSIQTPTQRFQAESQNNG